MSSLPFSHGTGVWEHDALLTGTSLQGCPEDPVVSIALRAEPGSV